MMAKWEKIEPNVGVLQVEVEAEKVTTALDKAFRKVVQRVNVPGFRKGKVPRRIFEARFGIESLYQDALDILLPEAYSEAVSQTEIEPVDRPAIDDVEIEVGKPLRFSAKVTVKPEVKLGDYSVVPYEDKPFVADEEQVAEELERLRAGHAELRVVEEAEAESGDLLIIDFKGYVDGESFEGGEAENYQLELGTGTFVGGFEDQLVGAKVGEDRKIAVTFPEEYHVKSLRGKEARFDVRVQDIKRRSLPELDDEFAKDISEFETFAELEADIVKNLEQRLAHEHEHHVSDAVIEEVTRRSEVDIPDVMIEHEIDQRLRDFAARLNQQGVPLDAYQEFTGATTEELRAQFRDEAARQVKTGLVLEAIAAAENVQATDEDCDEELQKVADSAQLPLERVRELMLSRDPGLAMLREQIKTRKTVELLVSRAEPVQAAVK